MNKQKEDIMKRILKAALLAAALLPMACQKTPAEDPEKEETPKVEPVSLELSFVLPANGEKTKWVAGDQIVVHGEYAAQQVTVTLTAGDISSDGKTARCQVDKLYPYVREDCASTLYASWPADAVENLKHCFFYSGFKDTNRLLMAASNDADNVFRFQTLTSPISFSVNGDFDSFVFAARKDAVIGYEFFQVKITDREQNLNQYRTGPLYNISGRVKGDGTTVHTLYVPGSINLPDGYMIKFLKNEKVISAVTEKKQVSYGPGEAMNLGNVSDLLKDFGGDIDVTAAKNLAAKDAANCYIVTAPGVYKFPAVKGNDASAVLGEAVSSVQVLWETWCNGEEVSAKSVVSALLYEEGNVYFVIPDNFHSGNALIAALDDNDQILWSWHIWVPETEPEVNTFGYTSGCSIMGRNLGALIDTKPGEMADPRSFGLLYQWGRKDPFVGAKAAGSTEFATIAGTAMTTTSSPMTQAEAAAAPTVFGAVEEGTDWCTAPQDRMYWGDQERSGAKTIYDPCPPGYRVAGRKRAKVFESSGSSLAGWAYDADNYFFQVGDPVSTLPLCGYIKQGALVPAFSCVWNTHMDNDTPDLSYCQWVGDGGSAKKGRQRAFGGSIRCETE